MSALRDIKEASEPPLYVQAVEGVGEEARNDFVDSMPPFEVVGLDADLLVDKLENCDESFRGRARRKVLPSGPGYF